MLKRKKKHIMLKITKHISGGEKQVTPWLLHQQNNMVHETYYRGEKQET